MPAGRNGANLRSEVQSPQQATVSPFGGRVGQLAGVGGALVLCVREELQGNLPGIEGLSTGAQHTLRGLQHELLVL